MNYFVLVLMFYSQDVQAKTPHCQQAVYDAIYRTVIEQSINSNLDKESILEKNSAIQLLRKLCRGQRSTFETGDVLGTTERKERLPKR